jgi:hypothetical protein
MKQRSTAAAVAVAVGNVDTPHGSTGMETGNGFTATKRRQRRKRRLCYSPCNLAVQRLSSVEVSIHVAVFLLMVLVVVMVIGTHVYMCLGAYWMAGTALPRHGGAQNRLRRQPNGPFLVATSTTAVNATTTPAAMLLPVQESVLNLTYTHTHPRQHAIPNILVFTHYTNLLDIDNSNTSNNNNMTEDDQNELQALRANVKHAISLHPGAQVRFLTDDDCVASLKRVMGNDTDLVHYFLQESAGMYKADLCRGAALYETGGLYFDVDLAVRMNIFEVLDTETTFSTVRVHLQSNHKGAFFQAFMAATPRNPIIFRYIELIQEYYQGRLQPPLTKDGPLGVLLLRRAYDQVLARDDNDNDKDSNNDNVHMEDTVEIWQELLYLPQFQNTFLAHVPPPVWGTRRACKFVVIAGIPTQDEPFAVVPFYSRIANSRMCPAQAPGEMGIYAEKKKKEEVSAEGGEEEGDTGRDDREDPSDGEENQEE